ncbi:MAG: universal stress protein [Allosphingosinicella sp.]
MIADLRARPMHIEERAGTREARVDGPPPRPGELLLACIDDTAQAQTVLAHAAEVAAALGRSLAVAHVIDSGSADRPRDPLDWTVKRHRCRDRLRALAAGASGTAAEQVLLEGPPADRVLSWVEANKATILAFGTRRRQIAGPMLLGSNAARLMSAAPGSVLLVPPEASAEADYRRILVPLDGSARAESVLPAAVAMARLYGSEILLLHVVPPAELTEVGPLECEALDLRDRLRRRNQRVARAYLDRIAARFRPTFRVRTLMTLGDARDCIREIAVQEKADLVLLSGQGHGLRPDGAFGKVAAHLAASAEAPILIVRDAAPAAAARAGRPILFQS